MPPYKGFDGNTYPGVIGMSSSVPSKPGIYLRDDTIYAIGPRHVARMADVLSSPVRVRVLELCSEKPRSLVELSEMLGVSRPAMSSHVRLLENYNLVKSVYKPSETGRGIVKLVATSVERIVLVPKPEA